MGERECGTLGSMRSLIFVWSLTAAERTVLEKGLRSPDAFVLRRCGFSWRALVGSVRPRIAKQLGYDDQTILDAVHAFNATGLQALQKGSSRAKRTCVWCSTLSRPSACRHSCTAARATLASPRVCGHCSWPPR